MAVRVQETETKYDAAEDVGLPALDDLPRVARASAPSDQELKAEYFDTEDLRLIRAGITLRRRTGGSDAGWHLKLPAGLHTREEIRLPLGRAARQVPRQLAELVSARTRAMPLQPVATITTRRRTITLLDQAGESLAEVADDNVVAHRQGHPGSDSRWREVEVELTGGDPDLLDAADELLRGAGLRPAGRSAKLERVLGSALPEPAGDPSLTPQTPAYQVIIAYLKTQAEVLKSLDPMVRRREPDSVHQMRVATRRLRSALRSFANAVSGSQTQHLADELQWLGGVLGAARDAEVQAARLQQHVDRTDPADLLGPVQERIAAHFGKAGTAAVAGVAAALSSDRYYALLEDLDATIANPPRGPDADAPAGHVLAAAVRRSYRKTGRRMRAARQAQAGQHEDAALHQARKAAKQARYAAEAVAPAIGSDAIRFADRMKNVQTALGEHQDTVVGRQLERELAIAAHQAGESAFSYGLFYARDAADGRQLRARARKAWKKAARRRDRRWLNAG